MLANNTYLSKILFRRDSASNWATNNPVLSEGEPGYEVDTGLFKIGDGVKDWKSLPYSNTFRALVPEVEADGKLYARTRAIGEKSGVWQEINIPDVTNKANKFTTSIYATLLLPDTCSQLYFGAINPTYSSITGVNNPREIRFQSSTTFFTITQTIDNVVKVSVTKDISSEPEVQSTLYDGEKWVDSEILLENDDIKFVFNSGTRIGQFITISTNTITSVNLLEDNYDGEELIISLDLVKIENILLDLEDVYNQMGRVKDVKILNDGEEISVVQDSTAIVPNYTDGEDNVIGNDIKKYSRIYSITFTDEFPTLTENFDFNLSGYHLVGNSEKHYIALNSVVLYDGEKWADSNNFYSIFNWDQQSRRLTPINLYTPGFTYKGGFGVQPNWSIIGDIAPTNGLLTKEIYDELKETQSSTTQENHLWLHMLEFHYFTSESSVQATMRFISNNGDWIDLSEPTVLYDFITKNEETAISISGWGQKQFSNEWSTFIVDKIATNKIDKKSIIFDGICITGANTGGRLNEEFQADPSDIDFYCEDMVRQIF